MPNITGTLRHQALDELLTGIREYRAASPPALRPFWRRLAHHDIRRFRRDFLEPERAAFLEAAVRQQVRRRAAGGPRTRPGSSRKTTRSPRICCAATPQAPIRRPRPCSRPSAPTTSASSWPHSMPPRSASHDRHLPRSARGAEAEASRLGVGARPRIRTATEVQDIIDMIEQPQRRRRRKTEPTEPPQHVTGAAHQPQPSSPDELFPDPQDTPESAQ